MKYEIPKKEPFNLGRTIKKLFVILFGAWPKVDRKPWLSPINMASGDTLQIRGEEKSIMLLDYTGTWTCYSKILIKAQTSIAVMGTVVETQKTKNHPIEQYLELDIS